MDEALRAIFVDEARRRLVATADGSRPARERADAAHGLMGAAGMAGASAIRDQAVELERALRDGDRERIEALHAVLTAAVDRLEAGSAPQRTPPPVPVGPDVGAFGDFDADEAALLRGIFVEEAEDHLLRILEAHQGMLRDPGSRPPLDALFRGVHTLKGSAGTVGLDAIMRASHELEDLCAELRAGRLSPTAGILERLDEGIGHLRALVEGLRSAPPRTPAPGGVEAGAPGVAPGLPQPEPETAAPPPGPVPGTETVDGDSGEGRSFLDRRHAVERRAERSLRVDSGRLDTLLDGVAELVILRSRIERRAREIDGALGDLARSRDTLGEATGALRNLGGGGLGVELAEVAARFGEVEIELTDTVAHLERMNQALLGDSESLRRTSEALEEDLRRARLVPLTSLFQRAATVAREVARRVGRRVEITATGGDTEADKGVIEAIIDPILHIVRNAVVHGLEPETERARAGKSAVGRIDINAHHEGDFVYLDVSDDGRGVDRPAVRRALERAGRLQPGEEIADALLLAALFEPGLSTRDVADELAGRGVGLDVVRQTVLRLGGQVEIESPPGAGTRCRLRLPLTTLISQALLFKVGGQVYAVPAAHVVEAITLAPEAVRPDGRAAVGGALLPVLRLGQLLGSEAPMGRHLPALHIRWGAGNFLATCDKIVGPRTIVVRSLGPLLSALPLFAGVTLSGGGKAQLLLDLAALAAAAARGLTRPVTRRADRLEHAPRVLVVDDSRLAREAGARTLTAGGMNPVVAEDGWEAWEILGEHRFDAVVTDLEMPRMDGFELLTRIRQDPTMRRLPVVVLSSRTSEVMRQKAHDAGADAFLSKGPSRRALLDALHALLRPV